jgi:hypothetical protein
MKAFVSLWEDGQSYPGRPILAHTRKISTMPYVYMTEHMRSTHFHNDVPANGIFVKM